MNTKNKLLTKWKVKKWNKDYNGFDVVLEMRLYERNYYNGSYQNNYYGVI